eukprot:scaffold86951_cov48-Cyclotella_meneghiniana.AAC.2
MHSSTKSNKRQRLIASPAQTPPHTPPQRRTSLSSVLLTAERKKIEGKYHSNDNTQENGRVPTQRIDKATNSSQESKDTNQVDQATTESTTPPNGSESHGKDVHPKILSGSQHISNLDRVHEFISSNADGYTPKQAFSKGDEIGFINTAKEIAQSLTATPAEPKMIFEFTKEAATHNSNLLEHAGFDYENYLKTTERNSTLTMGSELRPIEQLDKLLGHHPSYPLFRWNTIHGIDYPAADLPEPIRKQDLLDQIAKGNHKSALQKEAKAHVDKAMVSDIELGYGIPITIECITKLKDAEVYPIGLQHQLTIDENGNIIPKKRISHDLSNKRETGRSINQRVNEYLLPSVLYGYALLRFLHLIHNIRWNNPGKVILMNKIDIEKAYRRFHTTPKIASKCIAIWPTATHDEIGVLLTRLPFGSSPAPAHFSVGSDITCDLANDLTQCKHWDPKEVNSPLLAAVPDTAELPPDTPFGRALESDVILPTNQTAGTEGYIDDLATAVLSTETNSEQVERAKSAVLMALHLQFRPHSGDLEPIKRPEAASKRKLQAEGGLVETLTFLGWTINSRAFTIALPAEKAKAWSRSIKSLLESSNKVTHQTMATLVGRINHVAFIIPQARHFINRIRRDEQRAARHRAVKLARETKEDLKLWLQFITYAKNGISINSVIFRTPTSISISDACETGMGGYDPLSGNMWRHEFSEIEQRAFTLNTKEFLAAQISQELTLKNDPSEFPCHLNIGDSTVAEAWMYKSNHDPEHSPIQNAIARRMASNLIERKGCNYSQHIRGEENIFADSLSRDTHLPPEELIKRFKSLTHPLKPSHMQISPLSNQTTSWIDSLARLSPKKRELLWQHTPSTIGAGTFGANSSQKSQPTTTTSVNSPKTNETQSSLYSWIQSRMVSSTKTRVPSKAVLRERPQIMYQRLSSLVVGQTPDSTSAVKSASK